MAVSTREAAGGSIQCRSGRQTSGQTSSYLKRICSGYLFVLCWLLTTGAAPAGGGADSNGPGPDDAFVAELTAKAISAKAEAIDWAQRYGFAVRSEGEERDYELMALSEGRPMYYMTGNVQAAISTAADRIRDLSAWNLDGAGIIVGVWDAGGVRFTHQEFRSGWRVAVADIVANSKHSTHVGGTIGAEGKDPLAKGMAPAARIDSFDWNYDAAKMASRAAYAPQGFNRIYISNHSYGLIAGWAYASLYGNTGWFWTAPWNGRDSNEPWFGQYHKVAAQWDDVAFRYPYYLAFVAAGNERTDNPAIGETVYYTIYGGTLRSIVYDPNTCPPGDGQAKEGYDTLPGSSTAKNLMTVGAVGDAVSQGARSLADANMAVFGSWGPTDDGRVKPDIVANGIGVYSTDSNSDTSYMTLDGTSMACPNATGSATLLIQLYQRLFPNQNMRSSTLKGLIIHTADDLGRPGPDYQFGWGLMNARAAAELLQKHHDNTLDAHIVEGLLNAATPGGTYFFLAEANEPIRVTLCWTDPPGAAYDVLDSRRRQLVHDLDLRIIDPDGSTVYYPYTLNPAVPRAAAAAGDNNVDNVEQIYAGSLSEPGLYRIQISYKGQLTKNEQYYSLISSVPLFRQAVPTAKDGTATATLDKPVTITLSATDDSLPKPPGKLTYVIASLPSHGTLSPVGGATMTQPGPLAAYANNVVYKPGAGYTGYDTFTFYVDDGGTAPRGGISNTATVTVGVKSIATVEYQVCAKEDDGYAQGTWQVLIDDNLCVGTCTSAMRFRSVAVPRDVEILSASLRLCARGGNKVRGQIRAEAMGDAASLIARKIAELPTTQASVAWDWTGYEPPHDWTSSPDIRSVIQEVVDRPDWSGGNALMVIYQGLGFTTATGYFHSYDSSPDMAPRLTITYAPRLNDPPAVIPPAPVVSPSHSRPVAQDIELYACSSAPTAIVLSATDQDPCTVLSYGIASLPSHGTLEHPQHAEVTFGTVLAGGSNRVAYRADPNFTGDDSFTFYADDGATAPSGGKSNIATVTLNVRHMVTREYEVIAPEDDAYGAGGEPVVLSETLGVGKAASAMRFRNIDLAQGNEIVSAYLSICMSTTSIDKRTDGVLCAEAVGDANDFNEPGLRIPNLAKTQASVPWTWEAGQTWPAQTYALSPDIHAVIQEIVDREDWSISNDIAILYAGGTQNTQDLQFYACDKPYSTRAAKLQITYALKPDKCFLPYKGHPPVAQDVNVAAFSNERVAINLKATDDGLPDPPARLTYTIVSLPSHATLEYAHGGQITGPGVLPDFDCRVVYRAQSGFEGEDSFTFNADDAGTPPMEGVSNTAIVKLTVKCQLVKCTFKTDESSDDGYATPWNPMNILSDKNLSVGNCISGVRFKHVDIPRGSKILAASLGLYYPPGDLPVQINGVVQAEAVGDAAGLGGVERYLFTLPRTNASTAWVWGAGHRGDGLMTSPNFSEVLQEIVNRADWSSGNAMLIILSSKDKPAVDMTFYAYDYYRQSAYLYVTYAK